MNAAYDKLIQHFDEHDIRYQTDTDNQSICAYFRGAVGTYQIVVWVGADDDLLQVFGHSPVIVPAGSRPAIAETIARANWGLKVGKFELNVDDGHLRFHTVHILGDDHLADAVIERLVGTTMAMLDTYLPAILSVIYGNELPQNAVQCVEARPEE